MTMFKKPELTSMEEAIEWFSTLQKTASGLILKDFSTLLVATTYLQRRSQRVQVALCSFKRWDQRQLVPHQYQIRHLEAGQCSNHRVC